MKKNWIWLAVLFAIYTTTAAARDIRFRLMETTDVHGNYFPYDFINQCSGEGSLARIKTYVDAQRKAFTPQRTLLLDAGDILQGQPSAYYYNYIDTTSIHACAAIFNYMQYDAATIGNHDIEAGHAVYDRWSRQCKMPMLGANIINTASETPYWKPYTIIVKDGVRFAVLGMITTGIPNWLPENLWKGLRFDDMVETAKKYMPEMKAKADIIVGLFHSGVGKENATGRYNENASLQVAQQVPGFDVIFCGHDHRIAHRTIQDKNGKAVYVVNSGPHATHIALADITVKKRKGKYVIKKIEGNVVDVRSLTPDAAYLQHFAPEMAAVKAFTQEVIGTNEETLTTRPAFFGSSAFVDFIHRLQLKIGKADISFVAPLSFDAHINKGVIKVADMFNLYKYENMLYVMQLTGREIKNYLEYSYNHWIQTMKSPDNHLLLFNLKNLNSADAWQRLRYPSYNFDSGAGIDYEVDVRQPFGHRVRILQRSNGEPFDLDATFRVAVNSYRGNGGGGLLTEGAGIPKDQLNSRIVWSTDKDLRYYLMQEIRQLHKIDPKPMHQWKFIPEDWTVPAAQRDSVLLFRSLPDQP